MANVLETIMLICFGLSWPISLVKNVKTKSAKGISLKFLIMIILGYIAGIIAKFLNHQVNYVLVMYFLNILIVSLNLAVYFINRKYDKEREKEVN